jgi:A/G-specific adenine glycosylase
VIELARLSRKKAALDCFSQPVIQWFANNGRDFPWRNTKNSYHIFLAEILLRQTQAERVVGPYLRLIERYPTSEALSRASVGNLRKWFRPLGLVRRADQLISGTKLIMSKHGGLIPRSLDALLTLPGLGEYSARAVACLAFGAKVPMIDESSGRLLRRVFNLEPRGPAYCDRQLLEIAEALIPAENARGFNLGLLDIASAYCHHNTPNCLDCPIGKICSYSLNCTSVAEKTPSKLQSSRRSARINVFKQHPRALHKSSQERDTRLNLLHLETEFRNTYARFLFTIL